MYITMTLADTGEAISATNFSVNGSCVYITYIDASANLKVVRRFLDSTSASYGTSATIVQ